MKLFVVFAALAIVVVLAVPALLRAANAPKEGSPAPALKGTLHDGTPFDLADRKGKGWTVVYFYPKADTPGCTKQACAFRDSIAQIRDLGAEVIGVSADSVAAQKAFHEKHHLNFPLFADADGKAVVEWGVKMPALTMSKRWTFLVDPELVVRKVFPNVDPVADAKNVADALKALGAVAPKSAN